MSTTTIKGAAATFATILVWEPKNSYYIRIIDCARGGDFREMYLRMHAPPEVVIVNVRYDNEPPVYPP